MSPFSSPGRPTICRNHCTSVHKNVERLTETTNAQAASLKDLGSLCHHQHRKVNQAIDLQWKDMETLQTDLEAVRYEVVTQSLASQSDNRALRSRVDECTAETAKSLDDCQELSTKALSRMQSDIGRLKRKVDEQSTLLVALSQSRTQIFELEQTVKDLRVQLHLSFEKYQYLQLRIDAKTSTPCCHCDKDCLRGPSLQDELLAATSKLHGCSS
ncbi:hypothetical protein NLJ89_g11098 [Agrocybe chaxingu]|uniref:Uncharacterized protein n=1 Tax=Agrocybe chaxingu TaxID=84603 RepID=A0A9W8JQK2_9AGAR|nr:hypothetical protein NLJ89_g11098 [Agrocybe chaxingu]